MSRFHLGSPTTAVALAGALMIGIGGCASAPANPLQQHQASVVRQLTARCYWRNEGARVAYGGLSVHTACRRWATDRMRVSFAGTTPEGVTSIQ